MLKGHAKIELKNVNTGKVQTIEHDNLITNALNKQLGSLSSLYGYDRVNTEYLPLHEKGMGGIVLFQNALDESADNVCMPDETVNPIIGYASNAVNSGTDNRRGSRNLTESQELVNGYEFVYDFATNQGNGEIAALALTHTKTGESPKNSSLLNIENVIYRSAQVSDIDMYYLLNGVEFDWNTSTLICMVTTGTSSVTIRKYKINIGICGIGINDTLLNYTLLSEDTISLSSEINKQTVWLNAQDYYYGVFADNSKTVKVVRISKSSNTLDSTYDKTINCTQNIKISGSDSFSKIANKKNSIIVDDYLYYTSSNYMVKMNLIDTSDVTVHMFTVSYAVGDSLIYHNGVFYAGLVSIDKDFNVTAIKDKHYGDFFDGAGNIYFESVFVRDDGVALGFSNSSGYLRSSLTNFRDYLATVNNLNTPITKTSQDVMKITYTITEV